MKYMLMMNVPCKAPYSISTWPKKDVDAHLEFLRQFNRKLSESGEFVGVEGLTQPDRAKLIRAGKLGLPGDDHPRICRDSEPALPVLSGFRRQAEGTTMPAPRPTERGLR